MPLTTTFGSLSKFGYTSPSTLQITQTEYVTTYTRIGTQSSFTAPGPSGTVYVNTNNTFGITKLSVGGTVAFQYTGSTSPKFGTLNIDSSNNVYINDTTTLIKCDSNGNILWQKTFTISASTFQLQGVTTDSSNNVYCIIYVQPTSGSTYLVLLKFDSSGTLVNQRKVLNGTGAVDLNNGSLCFDSVGQNIIVSATKGTTGATEIYNGIYPVSNTTTGNTILRQYSATDAYRPIFQNASVTDGTYLYQCVRRTVSGINYYAYVKLALATGVISFSNRLSDSTFTIIINDVTIDGLGDLYVVGNASSGRTYVAKISGSTGNVVWAKRFTRSGTAAISASSQNITYKNGYIYFSIDLDSSTTDTVGYFKLKDDGSLPNGTYQSLYVIASVTLTVTALNSDNVGTLIDSTGSSSITVNNGTESFSTASLTPTTTLLP